MLFAISYDDSEVINNVSRQQPFQFIKQTVVIKYNIPSALVESQELLRGPVTPWTLRFGAKKMPA